MKRPVVVVLAACVLIAGGPCLGEEVHRKYRISLSLVAQSNADSLRTNASNTSEVENPFGGITSIDDPRPDSAVRNEMSIKDDWRLDLQASYGLLSWGWAELTLDAGIGYFEGDLRDLEVAGEFQLAGGGGVDPPRVACGELTRFHLFYIPTGTLEEIPVTVGATVRFRPTAKGGPIRGMNPYVGAGIGYLFADLDPSEEFLEFSRNVASSTGFHTRPAGNGMASSGRPHQFEAARIETPDTFQYYLNGGIDFPMGKGWTISFTAGYTWANDEVDITIDGRHQFGKPTPNGRTDVEYPETGLPVTFLTGGLVDYGSGSPIPVQGQPCKFTVGPQDGIPDTGRYYVQGGMLRYDHLSIGIGGRYRF